MKISVVSFLPILALISCQNKHVTSIATNSVEDSVYIKAMDFLDKGQSDSAFILFDEAKDAYLESKDSTRAALCMIQMAITLTETGDYFGAEELSFQTLKYLDHTDTSHYNMISSNYNNIANATGQLEHFEEALNFYDKALKFAANKEQKRNILNNKAVVLFDLRRFEEALEIYEKLMLEKRTKNVSYARALTNYARTRWRVEKSYNPLPDFWKAKIIREASQDMGEHSSIYSHIAEYYEERNVDSAIFYARKRMAVALQLEAPEDLRNALTILIRLEPHDSSKGLIERYRLLQDSVNSARSLSKNQFASVRYEAEKNKVDNAQLKNSLSEKIQKINLQRVWASIGGIFILLFAVWGYVRSKQRKERMKGEAAERIKINQLRTSRKVHDVVANGLYRVMSEITYIEVIDKEDILDKIEDMYNRSRDISYEAEIGKESDFLSFDQVISSLLKSFSSVKHKVFIVGNEEAIWDGMSAMIKEDIYRVLLELMIDMRKQSRAETVLIRFVREAHYFNITYKDNEGGVKEINGRNGILNTKTRIQRMGGKIIFESKEEADGLIIDIQIPII